MRIEASLLRVEDARHVWCKPVADPVLVRFRMDNAPIPYERLRVLFGATTDAPIRVMVETDWVWDARDQSFACSMVELERVPSQPNEEEEEEEEEEKKNKNKKRRLAEVARSPFNGNPSEEVQALGRVEPPSRDGRVVTNGGRGRDRFRSLLVLIPPPPVLRNPVIRRA